MDVQAIDLIRPAPTHGPGYSVLPDQGSGPGALLRAEGLGVPQGGEQGAGGPPGGDASRKNYGRRCNRPGKGSSACLINSAHTHTRILSYYPDGFEGENR